METIERWAARVVDGEVVVEDRELTTDERLDRVEKFLDDLSRDLVSHSGPKVRARAAIRHLLKSRGWVIDG